MEKRKSWWLLSWRWWWLVTVCGRDDDGNSRRTFCRFRCWMIVFLSCLRMSSEVHPCHWNKVSTVSTRKVSLCRQACAIPWQTSSCRLCECSLYFPLPKFVHSSVCALNTWTCSHITSNHWRIFEPCTWRWRDGFKRWIMVLKSVHLCVMVLSL